MKKLLFSVVLFIYGAIAANAQTEITEINLNLDVTNIFFYTGNTEGNVQDRFRLNILADVNGAELTTLNSYLVIKNGSNWDKLSNYGANLVSASNIYGYQFAFVPKEGYQFPTDLNTVNITLNGIPQNIEFAQQGIDITKFVVIADGPSSTRNIFEVSTYDEAKAALEADAGTIYNEVTVKAGDIIKLTADIEKVETGNVWSGIEIESADFKVLDLNGHSITYTQSQQVTYTDGHYCPAIALLGRLILEDNVGGGYVKAQTNVTADSYHSAAIVRYDDGKYIMNSGELCATNNGYSLASYTMPSFLNKTQSHGSFKMINGKIKQLYLADEYDSYLPVTINGGTIGNKSTLSIRNNGIQGLIAPSINSNYYHINGGDIYGIYAPNASVANNFIDVFSAVDSIAWNCSVIKRDSIHQCLTSTRNFLFGEQIWSFGVRSIIINDIIRYLESPYSDVRNDTAHVFYNAVADAIYMNNANIETISNDREIHVVFSGNNTITTEISNTGAKNSPIIIEGADNKTLNIKYIKSNGDVIIKGGGKVNITSGGYIKAKNLIIEASELTYSEANYFFIGTTSESQVKMNYAAITTPEDGTLQYEAYGNGVKTYVYQSGAAANGFSIASTAKEYNVRIAGHNITEANIDNLNEISAISKGTIAFDTITHTLTLDNVDIYSHEMAVYGWTLASTPLTINVIGECSLRSDIQKSSFYSVIQYQAGDLYIQGDQNARLYIDGDCYGIINFGNDLYINGGMYVNVKGTGSYSALVAAENIKVNASYLTVAPNNEIFMQALSDYPMLTNATIESGTYNSADGKIKITPTDAYKKAIITVTSANTSYGTVTGGGTYNLNDAVTVTATPADGYEFSHWVGAWATDNSIGSAITQNNPYNFSISTEMTDTFSYMMLTAHFVPIEYNLWIEGVKLNATNMSVFAERGVSYNAESNTLTLQGTSGWALISNDYPAIENRIENLTLKINGYCCLMSGNEKNILLSKQALIIEGTVGDTLDIYDASIEDSPATAINVVNGSSPKNLTIKGGIHVNALSEDAYNAIYCKNITIDGSSVHAITQTGSYGINCAQDEGCVTLTNCVIRSGYGTNLWDNTEVYVDRTDTGTYLQTITSSSTPNVQKIIRNGHVYIIRDGKTYTVLGAEVK